MSEKIIKFALKVAIPVWLVEYIIGHLASLRLNGFLIPIAFLVIGLMIVKHYFPTLFNFMKRFLTWTLKTVRNWLWQKGENKGGASVRQPRMRWRP